LSIIAKLETVVTIQSRFYKVGKSAAIRINDENIRETHIT